MEKIIKWGILGLGRIAHTFVKDLLLMKDAKVVAVGSRSMERANSFAKEYGVESAFGSYEELANCEDVDIIYIATPHSEHKECALMCLKAGKAVLCEKSFTVNAKEAEEVINCSRQHGVFLMEAMWTRYLPAIIKVREYLKKGILGDIRMVKADFSFRFEGSPEHRLFNPALAGGALLDVGIYTISLASMIFGSKPSKITGVSYIGKTGVDEQFSATLGYGDGAIAALTGAVSIDTPQDAWIFGTEGYIHLPDFWHAKTINLCMNGKPEESYELPYEGTGYNCEAAEAMRCIREGKLESTVMSLDESLAIMKIMDELRRQWGLKYPFE